MAQIVIADDGLPFDGTSLAKGPLGGAETAVIELAQALAARGHDVTICNKCDAPLRHQGVAWRPIGQGIPDAPDLYIANRGDKLLRHARKARRVAFWLHNPADYVLKLRYQWKLALRRPAMIFLSRWHAGTYPAWGMGGERRIVPLGVSELFTAQALPEPPPPHALFVSHPERGLAELLDLWQRRIRPDVPAAELHVYAGSAFHSGGKAGKAAALSALLDRVKAARGDGVILHDAVNKSELVQAYARARCLLYPGVPETFCLAVAEAQACGLPAIVGPHGALPERIDDGQTGYVAMPQDIADRAIALLRDDHLWRQHAKACRARAVPRWSEAAKGFEDLLA